MRNFKEMVGKVAALALALTLGASAALAEEITVVSREDGSGTRGAFVELTGVEEKNADGVKMDNTTEEAIITNSTNVMMTTVAGDTTAIGYISLGSLNDTVKAVRLEGVEATVENIQAGAYPLSRPFTIVTTGTESGVAADFIAYLLSAQGQAVVAENGYIPLSDAPEYAGSQIAGRVVVAGSSSVTPVMEKLKEAYRALNPNADIEIQQSDSTTGVQSALSGVCDIGMASRALKDSETEAGAVGTTLAMDGIAVILNHENALDDLTLAQVKAVYTGAALDWDELN